MKTIEKIQKKGYKVTMLTGQRNGMQSIIGVQIRKDGGQFADGRPVRFRNVTEAYNAIR